METIKFKKTNVPLMIVLSYFTAGIYIPYWFLTRRESFTTMQSNTIKFLFIHHLLTVNSFTLVYSLIKGAVFGEYGILILDSVEFILTFLGLGCLYFSVFRAKEMIEDELEETIYHPVLLLLFHVWYLQYKLNRLEMTKA